MAEWDRLVLCCSNNLPVTVSEKPIHDSFELCFYCEDSPSMEVINLPCCKASVHRHCVLKALQSNNQCVSCREVLDPQDIIDCTLQQQASSGEENIFQTTTLPELKAPPEPNMSQKDISANMNPPNILGEPPVQDEDMNLHEEPVEDEERTLSRISTFGKNNDNGLLFPHTCTTCYNENKYLSMTEKDVPTHGRMYALIALESTLFFPQV
jgi:hypothetical protein